MRTLENQNDLPHGDWPEWLALVWRQVGSLRFGTVSIVVHASRVIQIEKAERVRLEKPQPENIKQTENKH
jgi:hypothetical protein